ncbi:unknown [Clostridium sp. CAG:594]|nr:unknown [Clostridium sp. CAG:594]
MQACLEEPEVVAFSSVCTKFNLYDNDIVLVCLGKSSFVKSFINSIVIVIFLVSPFSRISPCFISYPFGSVTLNVRYLCCSCVNTVFFILSIFALIVPLFTKSTVYTILSPGIDKPTFIPVISAAFDSSIFAVPVVVALPIFVGLDKFSNLIPHFAASRYAVPFIFSVVDRAANATVKPAININKIEIIKSFTLLSFSILLFSFYYYYLPCL